MNNTIHKDKVEGLLAKADQALDGFKAEVRKASTMPARTIVGRGTAKFEIEQGESKIWTLWEEPQVSVARSTNTRGTEFPEHSHDQREWIIVCEGEMHVQLGDDLRVVRAGQHIFIPVGVKHSVTFPVDTRCVAVTVPKTGDFPPLE